MVEAFSSEKFGVLIEDFDGLYTLSGVISVEKNFSDSANSLNLALKGNIKIEFSSSESVEFDYPSLKIEGLYKNRRTIKWEGAFNFRDTYNNISSIVTFSKGPSFTNSKALPVDCFEGTLIKNNQTMCKV